MRSAVSQGIRRLEDSLGIALVQRSTRHVRLTEASELLHWQIAEPLSTVGAALEEAAAERPARGLLHVAITSIAESFLSGPLISAFAQAHPGVTPDVTVTDDESDIFQGGFNAGVGLGEVIEQHMVAVPLTGPQRQMVVATPNYLAQHGTPMHPRDLLAHCIGWRPAPGVAPYRWEFERWPRLCPGGGPRITTNDMLLMIRTALAGAGITIGIEETFQPCIARGELVTVLDDFLPRFAGFFLYFPNRKN